jgi:hypothetical protein
VGLPRHFCRVLIAFRRISRSIQRGPQASRSSNASCQTRRAPWVPSPSLKRVPMAAASVASWIARSLIGRLSQACKPDREPPGALHPQADRPDIPPVREIGERHIASRAKYAAEGSTGQRNIFADDALKGPTMARTGRSGLSHEQKAELWRRWRAGEPLSDIGRALGKHAGSVFGVVAADGGFAPAP